MSTSVVTQHALDTISTLSAIMPSPSPTPDGDGSGANLLLPIAAASSALTVVYGALRYWSAARLEEQIGPSKDRLLSHAAVGLDSVESGVLATPAAKSQTTRLLAEIVCLAQPTPQVAVSEDGGVETLWLVDDIEVSLRVLPDGSGSLAAYEPGREIFEYDFDAGTDPLEVGEIKAARHRLNSMGERVQHRVLV